ncbi:LysR family transcriptional regulator, partial [Burkholderia thailandensis]|nr:LysR family transcriptional regulator [Burkholderia thailandensis]
GLERAASSRFVLRRNPSTRHRLLDPLVAFLRQDAPATPVAATMLAPASNDAHARNAGGA